MQKIAYIFPGQGSQYVGMGMDLYQKYPAAKEVFDKANSVLGIDLKKICFEGLQNVGAIHELPLLDRTDISQPAILTTSIAALKAFEDVCRGGSQPAPTAAAGLSLGEYTALVAANAISFEEAVLLVHKRGQFMQEAAQKNKGAMASIIGLSKDIVGKICNEAGVQIANLNCPGQVVISGSAEGVAKAVELAKANAGTKAIMLNVSGAFHSKYMQEAGQRLSAEFSKIKFNSLNFPVVANVSAAYYKDALEIKDKLIAQVSGSVLWEDSMRLMVKDGVTAFMEIGPGTVLKGLARRIDSNIKVYDIGTVKDIEEAAYVA